MPHNLYQYKLEKYKTKYQEIQARNQNKLASGLGQKHSNQRNQSNQRGGNCKYFINHECGHLTSGRCGKIAKNQGDKNKNESPCVCNEISGVCVEKTGKRGMKIRLQKLEETLRENKNKNKN